MSFRDRFINKTAINFREFMQRVDPTIANSYPSMSESRQDEPYPGKQEIVAYLKSAYIDFIGSSYARDVFTGESTGVRMGVQSDDQYYWSNALAYYVEHYNVQLPQEFVEHIFASIEKVS